MSSCIGPGIWFAATEITPSPPRAMKTCVLASSPESTSKPLGRSRRMSMTWVRFPDASFTATMFACSASFSCVFVSMLLPVRPGTL